MEYEKDFFKKSEDEEEICLDKEKEADVEKLKNEITEIHEKELKKFYLWKEDSKNEQPDPHLVYIRPEELTDDDLVMYGCVKKVLGGMEKVEDLEALELELFLHHAKVKEELKKEEISLTNSRIVFNGYMKNLVLDKSLELKK